jgi:hypothetical protein
LALWAAVLFAGGGLCRQAAAGPIMIDNFAFAGPGQLMVLDPAKGMNPSKVLSHTSGTAIGGQGDLMVNVVGQSSRTSSVNFVGWEPAQSLNALQIGTNGLSPSVITLQYSGTNNQNTGTSLVNTYGLGGGLGIDLTGGGTNDRFQIRFVGTDAQPSAGLDLSVIITSPLNGNPAGRTSTLTGLAPNLLSPHTLDLPFSSLVGNAVLTQVTSLVFTFNGSQRTPNIDFEILQITTTQITTVPEPGGLVLLMTACLAVGLFACHARRRRGACLVAGPPAG